MNIYLNKYIILGHDNPDIDSIISGYLLEKLMLSKGFNAKFIIPDKKIDLENITICNTFGLNITSYQKELPETKGYKYLLVDHHIRKVNGPIVAVIDHHPDKIGLKIPWYQNEISSSTSCIICREHEEYFNKQDIELAILAAMVDTASFNSTKTKKEDITKISSEIAYIIDSLMKYVKENDLKLFVFIVHDMSRFKTTVYDITSKYYNVRSYEFYTSRGNTIMPQTEEDINAKLNLRLK